MKVTIELYEEVTEIYEVEYDGEIKTFHLDQQTMMRNASQQEVLMKIDGEVLKFPFQLTKPTKIIIHTCICT